MLFLQQKLLIPTGWNERAWKHVYQHANIPAWHEVLHDPFGIQSTSKDCVTLPSEERRSQAKLEQVPKQVKVWGTQWNE